MVNRYKIADKVVEVTSIHAEVHEYCSDYLTEHKQILTLNVRSLPVRTRSRVFRHGIFQTATSKNWQFTAR